jgi:multiple sugar transport system permease protein
VSTLALKPVRRHPAVPRAKRMLGRALIYAALLFWTFICLFPIYWTVTTSFKSAVDVTQAHLIPWVDFQPDWKGWRSLGLSPDTLFGTSTARAEFTSRSSIASSPRSARPCSR